MKKNIAVLLGVIALGLMSCIVVVNDEDECHKSKNDGDTVTIIFSQTHTGTAAVNPVGK